MTKKIVRGNDFTLRIPVRKVVKGEKVAFALPSCTDIVVNVVSAYKRVPLDFVVSVADDSVIEAKMQTSGMALGAYALEVKGKQFGNAWRSNEYEQITLVDNNASGNTEIDGELIEGEGSVEMDTAIVIFPPSVELSGLIDDTNKALDTVNALGTMLNAAEEKRAEAENQRKTAEEERAEAEESRVATEESRVEAEMLRTQDEGRRTVSEKARESAETARAEAEKKRVAAEESRVTAEAQRAESERGRSSAEEERVAAETERATEEHLRDATEMVRVEAEKGRVAAEESRVSAEEKRETDAAETIKTLNTAKADAIKAMGDYTKTVEAAEAVRVTAEESRVNAETARKDAETARAAAEVEREKKTMAAVSNAETATKNATAATAAAQTATTGAEKVNAVLTEENTFEVTDRTGAKKTVDITPAAALADVKAVAERGQQSMGHYSKRDDITLVATQTNYVVNASGVKTYKGGWAMAEFTAELGNEYLFKPGVTDGDVCVFAEAIDKVETRAIDYALTYDEQGRVATATATYNGKTYTYTYAYSDMGVTITDQSGAVVKQIPSVYTTTVGSYSVLTRLNADAELPEDGYCRFVSNFQSASAIKVVVSYKVGAADLVMKVLRDGNTASMCTQLSKINKKVDELAEKTVNEKGYVKLFGFKEMRVAVDGVNKIIPAHELVTFDNITTFSMDNETQEYLTYFEVKGIPNLLKGKYMPFNKATNLSTFKIVDKLIQKDTALFMYNKHFLLSLNAENIDTSKSTTLTACFRECGCLEELDLSFWDTKNVTTIDWMFYNCVSLKNLNLSAFDTSNVTNINNIFCGCLSLTNLSLEGWDTSKVLSARSAFANVQSLRNTPLGLADLNFSSCTDMTGMFSMFIAPNNFINAIKNWNTSACKDMSQMFYRASFNSGLILTGWDTSVCENMSAMFANVISPLINISSFDLSSCGNIKSMFLAITNLTSLTLGEGIGKMKDECGTLDLSGLSGWKNDTVKSLLTLYDRRAAGMGVITIKLHANTKAVLGEDGIAQLTAKGYTIA